MSNVRTKNTTASIVVNTLLIPAIFYFFGPFMMMVGWNIVALKYNLAQFNYWQMFCICNGLHWFIKGFRK